MQYYMVYETSGSWPVDPYDSYTTSYDLQVHRKIQCLEGADLVKGRPIETAKRTKVTRYIKNGILITYTRQGKRIVNMIQYSQPPTKEQVLQGYSALNGLDPQFVRLLELIRKYTRIADKPYNSLYQVTSSVIALDHQHLMYHIPWSNFAIGVKFDGLHCVFVSQDGYQYIVFNKTYIRVYVTGLTNQLYIIEGELVDSVLCLYDLIVLADEDITNLPYLDRLNRMQDVKRLSIKGKTIYIKMVYKSNANRIQTMSEAQEIAQDGIIFTENAPYKQYLIYKWKPRDLCTVDFLVQKSTVDGQQVGILYSKANKWLLQNYAFDQQELKTVVDGVIHIPFQASILVKDINIYRTSERELDDIDGTICEFSLYAGKWKLYKKRPDKTTANSIIGAESIYMYLYNPITVDQLSNGIDSQYFQVKSGAQYKQMRLYMNAVKSSLITQYCKDKVVTDLGVGMGQDLKKYRHADVKTLIGVDADIHALYLLIYRKVQMILERPVVKLYIRLADLNTKEALELLPVATQSDCICSFFSFHYFYASYYIYDLFKAMGKGKVVIIACVDSVRLRAAVDSNGLLSNASYSYMVKDGRLHLKLPFAKEMYQEDIVDRLYLIKNMSRSGLALAAEVPFDSDKDHRLYKSCSEYDKLHISLYKVYIFKS